MYRSPLSKGRCLQFRRGATGAADRTASAGQIKAVIGAEPCRLGKTLPARQATSVPHHGLEAGRAVPEERCTRSRKHRPAVHWQRFEGTARDVRDRGETRAAPGPQVQCRSTSGGHTAVVIVRLRPQVAHEGATLAATPVGFGFPITCSGRVPAAGV